jgi:hypothetical protein
MADVPKAVCIAQNPDKYAFVDHLQHGVRSLNAVWGTRNAGEDHGKSPSQPRDGNTTGVIPVKDFYYHYTSTQ